MHFLRYGLYLLIVPLTVPTTLWAQIPFTSESVATGVRSWGVSWIDFDGDGDLDLFASRHATSGGNVLLRNNGGTFALVDADTLTAGPGSIGHSWGDFDNDGDPDVLTIGGTGGFGNTGSSIRLLLNEGPDGDGDAWSFKEYDSSPFSPTDGLLGWSGAWGDYDNDGLLDFVIAHAVGFVGSNQTNHLFRHVLDVNDLHFFARVEDGPVVTGLDTYTIPSWSDYDLDGDLDLFIGSGPAFQGQTDEDNLYENNGDGTFNRIEDGIIATDRRDGQVMNWQDIDNDGDLDLFVTNFAAPPDDLYRNNGDGTFTKDTEDPLATDNTGNSLANTWGDLDNDGDLDVLITEGGTPGTDRLYVNDGAGNFTLDQSFNNGPTSGASLGDYDNDGDLDIAVVDPAPGGGPVILYRNDLENENGWIEVDLVGTTSNRSAIGAKVRATATIGGTEVTQFREVSAQNTFSGQNALTVHFGLGDATSVTRLDITWPSGVFQTFGNLSVGNYLITEGSFNASNETAAPEPVLALDTPYPNPFATITTIRYTVPDGPVRLTVYDVLGRRIRTLVDTSVSAGVKEVTWDSTDDSGRALSAGLYLLRLDAAGQSVGRQISLVR